MVPRDSSSTSDHATLQDASANPSPSPSRPKSASLPHGAESPAPVPSPPTSNNALGHLARSSLNLSSGPKDGVPHPPATGNRFVRDIPALSPGTRRSQSASPFRLTMPSTTPGQLAFSAMQFLPVPVLVLNNFKTVVLANQAFGRLVGMAPDRVRDQDGMVCVMDHLRGQSLSQVGIDLVQDNGPVWIEWEQFLDQVAAEMGVGKTRESHESEQSTDGDATPTSFVDGGDSTSTHAAHFPSPNAVVEVVISKRDYGRSTFDSRIAAQGTPFHEYAKMIISAWEISERQTYFTLTFTHTELDRGSATAGRTLGARSETMESIEKRFISSTSGPPSLASSSSNSRSPSCIISPSSVSLSSSPFPPMGPPSKSSISSAPSILQKITIMKDALLDNTQTPVVAMWKDGSVTFPNRAARELFNQNTDLEKPADGFDLLPAWTVWTEDFSRQLDPAEYPISILLRTETPFTGRRIGMLDADGNKLVFDSEGAAITDDNTGEFLAGVVTCRDVTKLTEEINQIRAADAERFKLICDTMPQLVWTARPDGSHDFFNGRWYNYTGLSVEESIGAGWKNPFHPDDMAETEARWLHSLRTGEPYMTEYRCRRKDGEWRWFLGRALPLKNKKTGEIEKWFGTCTDVHESIEAKLEARRTRQQLLSVIAHSRMTMFTVGLDRAVTMLEGALIWDSTCDNNGSKWYIGENVYDVFNRLSAQLPEGQMPPFLRPLESILTGAAAEDIQEHEMDGRWYRTRLQTVLVKNREGDAVAKVIEGVIGLIMDVTELKARERDIEAQEREKRQLVANEAAAKEASRLKSQFLANMSHEIRTPITGVMGMAELLLDLNLEEEQRELTENIYRSGNALLTVINDILDFSKVESGRLDIEEVQFSLSVIIRDVNKMLSFAAERKNLEFQSNIAIDIDSDLVVMGDPGRVRQIITNLITNSIKFTNQGFVKFSVMKEEEGEDLIEIRFVIEDTGIGIEDDVRKRLFQPFSQGDPSTARKFGGTGLGLTISKNLLDLMNGRMTLESTVGTGTTATFWIPFKRPQGAQDSRLVHIDALPDRLQSEMSVSCNSSEYEQFLTTPPGEISAGALEKSRHPWRNLSVSLSATGSPDDDLLPSERANIHILVVEDNAINQQIAIKTIKKLGFQTTATWNGKEALEYLTAAREGKTRKPDIILMDVQMPVIDGYKCTHLLRHHLPYKSYVRDIPIVAMTASAIQGDKEKCKKAGMDDYLAKPVKGKTLERMLLRWLTSRRPTISPPDGSVTSDCSEASEQCNNADIPGVGLDAEATGDEDCTPVGLCRTIDYDGSRNGDEKANLPTPRPLVNDHLADHFPGYTITSPSPSPSSSPHKSRPPAPLESMESDVVSPLNNIITAEMALQSRDDKLMDAAGASSTHQYSSPMMDGGEALTEENIGRLEEESFKKRLG